MNQLWPRLFERRVIKAESRERPGSEVLDDDIRLVEETMDDPPPLGPLEVERNAFLVAVRSQEICALARDEWRAPRACLVSVAWTFHLDDARAHVGQEHRAIRAGQDASQIENEDATQWAAWGHAGSILVTPNLDRTFRVRICGEEIPREARHSLVPAVARAVGSFGATDASDAGGTGGCSHRRRPGERPFPTAPGSRLAPNRERPVRAKRSDATPS